MKVISDLVGSSITLPFSLKVQLALLNVLYVTSTFGVVTSYFNPGPVKKCPTSIADYSGYTAEKSFYYWF